MINYFFEIMSFALGLCVGSFLNVCIYRLPASQSIVKPPSHCPECDNLIRFYDNIPVFSYMILKGKCRHCKTHIPIRYPLVELLGGLFALAVYIKYGWTIEALIYFSFVAALLTITFIDIDHQIIPDIITLPGIPLCFAASLALSQVTILESIIGITIGGGTLLAVAWVYQLIAHRPGMGGGDIKLLAMIGAIIGWKGVLFVIFASSAIGTLTGIIVMIRARKGMKLAVPFGPFLSVGAVLYIFFGSEIIYWYINILR